MPEVTESELGTDPEVDFELNSAEYLVRVKGGRIELYQLPEDGSMGYALEDNESDEDQYVCRREASANYMA